MPRFKVVTAVTAYESYVVDAASADEAERLVRSSARRTGKLGDDAAPEGFGDDLDIISVQEEAGP